MNMKKIFNKNFWAGFIAGILFTLLYLFALGYWMESHPVGDCDSCMKGTTP